MAETGTTQELVVWTIGERIRKAREDRGWKQTDLAAELRVSRSAIAGWENNEHDPSYLALKAVADLTGKPIWWLEGHDAQPPSGGVPTLQDRRPRNRRTQGVVASRCIGDFAGPTLKAA